MMLAALILAMVNSVAPAGSEYDAIGALGLTSDLAVNHNWFCAATLVGESAILTAQHCLEPNGTGASYSVRWRRHTNGTIGSKEAGPGSYAHSVIASWYLPTGDVAIGYLSEPVTHIASITPRLGGSGEVPGFVGGWGRIGPGQWEGELVELRICETTVTYHDAYWVKVTYAWGLPPSPTPKCGPNSNDSGGAVIVDNHVVGVIRGFSWQSSLAQYVGDEQFEALLPFSQRAK